MCVNVDASGNEFTMKTLVIGDLHTKMNNLQRFDEEIEHICPDKIILTGDYLDDWGVSSKYNLASFNELLSWLDSHENVIALIGNHDYAYLDERAPASGKTKGIESEVANLIAERWGSVFCLAYGEENWLFTHAGVTEGWWHAASNETARSATELAEEINNFYPPCAGSEYLNMVGRKRGGYSKHASPLWADMMELIHDPLVSLQLNQCVGHTPVRDIGIVENTNSSLLVFCDTFSTSSYGYPLGNDAIVLIDTKTNEVNEVRKSIQSEVE